MEEHSLAALPTLGQCECAAIRTNGVLVEIVVESGNAWRFVLERISHIIIYRHIVASHFPIEGHSYVVPAAHVGLVAVEVLLLGHTLRLPVGCVMEFPLTVERQPVGMVGSKPWESEILVLHHFRRRRVRHKGGMSLLFAVFKLGFILDPRH